MCGVYVWTYGVCVHVCVCNRYYVNVVFIFLGSYFAVRAYHSHPYTEATYPNANTQELIRDLHPKRRFKKNIHKMFVAKVLCGRYKLGQPHYVTAGNHDSCVDNMHNPNYFVIFDKPQCIPYCIIEYEYKT